MNSTVYFTKDVSANGLLKIFDAFNIDLLEPCGVKISTGELGGHYFLDPKLIAPLVDKVNGTIIECNTAYGGKRMRTKDHKQTIRAHGFYDIANVNIMDEQGDIEIPVKNGKHLRVNFVGKDLADYYSILVLSHFKGHAMAGFGGAIKNLSIGTASSHGKLLIHSAGKDVKDFAEAAKTKQEDFLESMAEAAGSVIDYIGTPNILYISVANNLSVDCDCDAHPAKPEMADLGIFASTDPVALDDACVQAVVHSDDRGKQALMRRIAAKKGMHLINYMRELGYGSRHYNVVNIDEN